MGLTKKEITLKKLITTIAVLQFILIAAVYSNTLVFDEQGNILAETDRYLARFERGVLSYFYNKLTQETHTHEILRGEKGRFRYEEGKTAFFTLEGGVWASGQDPIQVKRISPLDIELIYQYEHAKLHLFIGIDPQTDDLLIRQTGITQKTGAIDIMWGMKNLSHADVDVILPYRGGQILAGNAELNTESLSYDYPGGWEAQLAIFQGKRGGFFVRSDDTKYQFKDFRYERHDDNFRITFGSLSFAPFEKRKRITSATWRLNAYQGDWQVPALLYREWMHKTFQPPDRKQMPAWVNDIECIIKDHGELDLEKLRILNQLVDASKTLIYIYGWHEDGGDPPYSTGRVKPNFSVFVKEAQRYGFRIMPHTSMIAIQEKNPFYLKFEKYQIRDPWSGEKTGYRWDDPTYPHRPAYINIASRAFREMFVSELKHVWETYKVDAFHLDFSHAPINDMNGLIDGLTMAEGNVLLHQELRESIPGIVLSGESLTELSFLHESFAQRWHHPKTKRPHPIGSFLFSPYVRFYGHLGFPNPDDEPEQFQEFQEEYEIWGVLPTITVWNTSSLAPDRVETHKMLKLVRQRQNWVFGDVNSDGVVNVLDLVLISQHLGTEKPSNRTVDINSDGVVNILDLTLVAQQLATSAPLPEIGSVSGF